MNTPVDHPLPIPLVNWPTPPARLRDPGTSVHLLHADLEASTRKVALYRLMLDPAELRRVDDIRHPATRDRMAVSLGLARLVRSAHATDEDSCDELRVSHARAGPHAIFAVTRSIGVGTALVPVAAGAPGVALAALEAIGNGGGRGHDPSAIDVSRVAMGLASGQCVTIRTELCGRTWFVQVLGLGTAHRVIIASAGSRRALRCWRLSA